jgi:hypothetical protein
MRHRLPACLLATIALSGAGFLAPLTAPGAPATADAAVTKSMQSDAGGGNVAGAGNRLGNLLSGWAVPVLIVLGGCLLVGALASRNIGASVGIVVITLLGLIFLLSPQSIESLAKGIANVVF